MAKKDPKRPNYQKGGPSGRGKGDESFSFTLRKKLKGVPVKKDEPRGRTQGVHVRCGPGDNGERNALCGFMRKQFKELVAHLSEVESDEELKAERAKAARKGKRK